jgi:hypothetical protein
VSFVANDFGSPGVLGGSILILFLVCVHLRFHYYLASLGVLAVQLLSLFFLRVLGALRG